MDGRIKAESDDFTEVYAEKKQYFEQRKRKQQHTALLDSSADVREQRSLDVLSLQNFSTTAEEHKYAFPDVDQKMKYPTTKDSLKICTRTETFADSVAYKEAETSLGQAKTICPANFKCTATDSQNDAFNGRTYHSCARHTTTDQQISVFDLLADDGPSGNLEGSPVHEAHVSFSVEGLGRVGTQTPLNSPERSERMFQRERSSPRNKAKRQNPLKDFDHVLDDLGHDADVMMQEKNTPRSGSCLEFSSGKMNSRSHRKQKYSTLYDSAPLNGYGSKLESSFGDSNFFHGIGKNNEDDWDARFSFLDDSLLNEKETNASGSKWAGQGEGTAFYHHGNELSDYSFQCPSLYINRFNVKGADKHNKQDFSSLKEQRSENYGEFVSSKTQRFTAGRHFDFDEPISHPDWSYPVNAKDNLSLPSEESCSTTAVRGEAKTLSPSNSVTMQRTMPRDISGRDGHTIGVKNIYTNENEHLGNYPYESEKCKRKPSLSKIKKFHHVNSPFQEKLGQQDSLLFEEGYTAAAMLSDFRSFCQTSEIKDSYFGSKQQIIDSLSGFPIPESQMDGKCFSDGSRYRNSVQYSSLGRTCEKLPFCKSVSHMSCHDSPMCRNQEFLSTNSSLSLDSEPGCSFHTPRNQDIPFQNHGETLFPNLHVLECISKVEGSQSKASEAKNKMFEPDKGSFSGNNCPLSVNKQMMNPSNFEDSVIECHETNGAPLEQKGSTRTTPSPLHADETSSSSVKNPDRVECRQHADIPLIRQDQREEITDVGPEKRTVSNRFQLSSPVVTLESYVLKLLYVQKVLKDASEQIVGKPFP